MDKPLDPIPPASPARFDYDVLLLGNYFCDIVFTGLPGMPELGKELFSQALTVVPGGCFHYANALTRLGLRVAWPGEFGGDLFSRYILELVRASGIDTSFFHLHTRPFQQVTVALSFPEDRAFVTYCDSPSWGVDEAVTRRARPRLVLFPGLARLAELEPLLALRAEMGFKIYMDCQHVDASLDDPQVAGAIAAVDIFAPNAGEARRLTGEETLERAVERLAGIAPLVVIKNGAQGALACQGVTRCQAAAIPVQPIDTTAAGDCFNAGFVYGYLNGLPLETCLRYGNIAGGLSTTAPGSLAAPRREELLKIAHHTP